MTKRGRKQGARYTCNNKRTSFFSIEYERKVSGVYVRAGDEEEEGTSVFREEEAANVDGEAEEDDDDKEEAAGEDIQAV